MIFADTALNLLLSESVSCSCSFFSFLFVVSA